MANTFKFKSLQSKSIIGGAGSFTTLTANNGIINASAPVLDLAQTWNNSGVTFTGMRFNAAGTSDANSAAASLLADFQVGGTSFLSVRKDGVVRFRTGNLNITAFQIGNVTVGTAGGGGELNVNTNFSASSLLINGGVLSLRVPNGQSPVFLARDDGDIFAQRNGLNPQTFRLYGQITGTDTSATGNYERGYMRWSAAGGTFQIGTEKGTSGSARPLEFQTDGVTRMTIAATGAVSTAGNLTVGGSTVPFYYPGGLWAGVGGQFAITGGLSLNASLNAIITADAADIIAIRRGAVGQTFRVYNIDGTNFERGKFAWESNILRIGTEKAGTGSARALQFQTDGTTRFTFSTGGSLFIGDGSAQTNNFFGWSGNGGFRAQQTSTGVITLLNWAETDFNRLQFGGTTSNFPALKRSSTALQVRLADDTAFAPLEAGTINATGAVAATSFIRANGFQCSTGSAGITFGDGFTSIVGPSTAGVLRIQAFNNTDVLIGIGGNTSSWPALNSSGSTLRIRLADNSGFAPLSCGALTLNGNLDASTRDIVTDTTTGTKIGTGTTQKLGFYGATPVDRPATVADPAGGGTVDAEARTAINELIDRLQELGLIA